MLIHTDNYCLADFSVFERAHNNRPLGCLMTMMTFRTDTPSSCGIVEVDENGVVIGFHEKVENPPSNRANAAVYAFDYEFLLLPDQGLDTTRDLLFSFSGSRCLINLG